MSRTKGNEDGPLYWPLERWREEDVHPADEVESAHKPSEAGGQAWGDKGCEHRPDRCQHAPDEGCMWCCMKCNTDTHLCPGCGTPVGHKDISCRECWKL